jgi:hypothetical protein
MHETFDPELEKSSQEYHPGIAVDRLQKEGTIAINKLKRRIQNNFPTILLGSLIISFLVGYFISERYEAQKREQWAELLFRQVKEWLSERGRKAAVPLKGGLEYARSAAEEVSTIGAQYGRRLNPFYREPRRRFFGIIDQWKK